ncbi:hypothetical protein GKE82_05535 [Conexibacter sp. W3-3-2]|uniref:hypothetical protein n=1 Tax=Conexibacter sp. W3-3-2 TaxID=2675227 RepID=UPI0012B7DC33|nr:hypothetical protein [Conexibacter sp. W3-3-2]MTD43781.1 hypothetical protein [Conexibacter sp. W3-3-2]
MLPNTIQVVAIPEQCYRCGGVTRGIVGVLAPRSTGTVFREFDDVAEALANVLDPEVLRVGGIGPIKLRRSRTRGRYMSNGCVHCDAILGSFPLWERLNEVLSEGFQLHDFALSVRVGDPARQ